MRSRVFSDDKAEAGQDESTVSQRRWSAEGSLVYSASSTTRLHTSTHACTHLRISATVAELQKHSALVIGRILSSVIAVF